MGGRTHLLIGIGLIMIVVVCEGMNIAAGKAPTTRGLLLDGTLIVFALRRFVMFAMPASPLSMPLRILGIAGLVGYFAMKWSH